VIESSGKWIVGRHGENDCQETSDWLDIHICHA